MNYSSKSVKNWIDLNKQKTTKGIKVGIKKIYNNIMQTYTSYNGKQISASRTPIAEFILNIRSNQFRSVDRKRVLLNVSVSF